jgi:guanylate cyclase
MAARLGMIGADPYDDEDLRQKKALLVLLAVLILPVAVVWAACYFAFGSPVWILSFGFGYFVISVGSLVVFARTRSFMPFLVTQLLDVLLLPALAQMVSGGFIPIGGVGLWGILAPLGALVFLDVRQAIWWFIGFVTAFVLLGIAGELYFLDTDLPKSLTNTMLALNVVGSGAVSFTVLASFANQRNRALAALRVEQDKSEALLVNILPSSIAARLKAPTQTIADQFECASVIFADVVGFTPLSERLAAAEVVGMLDTLFSRFDVLAERHGLEKIKTIGDCYMAAAGVPDPSQDHARRAALMALAMRDAVATLAVVGQASLELRIGINSGPIVAGVIGTKRFTYDLYGDAVNTASRMQSHSMPGEIQITHATKELLKDEFVCRRRGVISIKGKGEMETWFLVGPRLNDRGTERGIASDVAGAHQGKSR